MPSSPELEARGIYTYQSLGASLQNITTEYIIDGLFMAPSINVLAGDSGIGKTPFCLTIALCVAAGIPFIGQRTPRPRRVLYCDGESSKTIFHHTVTTLAKYLGLPSVPENFHVWSPYWDHTMQGIDFTHALFRNVEWTLFKPEFVVVDPLRIFFSEGNMKQDQTMESIKKMRRVNNGTTGFLLTHHTRKPNTDKPLSNTLEDDPHNWFHEVAGQHALINHVDTRLGMELTPGRAGSDMTVAGIMRMSGPVNPLFLTWSFNDDGEPQGYMRSNSLTILSNDYQQAFYALPQREIFTYKMASATLGKSDAAATNMLKRLMALGAIKKIPGGYKRVL
jgi:hypothetical protein